ncbi:MAG TPA: alpha-amylase family protein [Candidatus Acidoferrales bacterium]|nr:alpha-amylase family protein [Candidatus Acidoferrales bacterium]
MTTRREFVAGAAAAIAATRTAAAANSEPWYRRTYRWGQTNITEKDPERYDIAWWREFWKRTRIQGVIVNAGGIVAYYPSKFPLQHRAEYLGGRDLYGDLAKAAHDDGLVVVARMDSNRTAEDFFQAHPDWFARNSSGNPYRAADKYVTCVNGPYYDEYLPAVLAEIIERSHPEGFADNSWSGLGRDSICYCDNCARKFRDKAGAALPSKQDWSDPVYRRWIDWNYARRIEIWDLNNRTTKAAGGPDCMWFGMNSGSVAAQSRSFRDCKAIFERAEMVFLDHQARGAAGFEENADTGKLVHGMLGWDKIAPESMAMYQAGRGTFRVASKPAAEARFWMFEGFAGGIQPWWHHIGAYHEDRRMYHTAEPVMKWHEANQAYLVNRRPLATVGVVWSQRNTDFYGQDRAADLVDAPYRGFTASLVRARIPYVPIHIDHIERDGGTLRVLILPNVAAISDAQCAAIRKFVAGGGALIATGVASLCNEFGDARSDYGLADLFGAHFTGTAGGIRAVTAQTLHSYLRLDPELRAGVWGPHPAGEPPAAGRRHAVLSGFEDTDILPFGGTLAAMKIDSGVTVPLTFIPPFPVLPPETSWMRQPKTDIPGLVLNGRVAFLPADIDRLYSRDNLPDHAALLANLVRWAANGDIPLQVEGRGMFDCSLYTQPGRVIAHVVNLTATGRMPVTDDDLVPSESLKFSVRLPAGVRARSVRMLVAGKSATAVLSNGWARVVIPPVLDHEVLVIE